MTHHHSPFSIDLPLSPSLDRLLGYWRGLLRGEATVPFADDLNLAKVEALADEVFLLGVFEKPQRFRLDLAHTRQAHQVEATLTGRFIDEVELPNPLEFLKAQASATVESLAPSFYEHRPKHAERGYGRLLLPAWGEGHVSLLLGAVEFR
jgi:hypothetical protein